MNGDDIVTASSLNIFKNKLDREHAGKLRANIRFLNKKNFKPCLATVGNCHGGIL